MTPADTAHVPTLAAIPAKKLKSLATKIKKLKSTSSMSNALTAAGGGDVPLHVAVQYLLNEGHLDPMSNGALLHVLASAELDDATAVAIAETLAARDEAGLGLAIRISGHDSMEGWPEELDEAVFRAYRVAPAAFVERASRYAPLTRRGLAFVARRCGHEVDAAMAAEVITELARMQSTSYGICSNVACPYVDDAGCELAHDLYDLAALRTIVLRFAPLEQWDRALVEATRRNQWGLIEMVASAIEQLPLEDITTLFAARFSMFGDSSSADEHIVAIMDRRADTPDELLAEVTATFAHPHNAPRLRAVYAAAAERKRAARG